MDVHAQRFQQLSSSGILPAYRSHYGASELSGDLSLQLPLSKKSLMLLLFNKLRTLHRL